MGEFLGEPREVWDRLARAGEGLREAVPEPKLPDPIPEEVLQGLGEAWAARPTPPTPREVGAKIWGALPPRPRGVRDVPGIVGTEEANPLEFFITEPILIWAELPIWAVVALVGALWAGWLWLRPMLPEMPEIGPLIPTEEDLRAH